MVSGDGEAEDLLRRGLGELGLPCGDRGIQDFLTYLGELRRWNRAYNLTGLRSDRDIVIKGFLDSLLFSRAIPSDVRTLADIGSGAGFPGIPLRIILPHIKVFLVEPTGKKAIFLRRVSHILGHEDTGVIERRIEEVQGLTVDVAVTRALFTVSEFMEKTGGLVREGGLLILSKGPKLEEELAGLPAGIASTHEYRLPFLDILRRIVVMKKDGA